MFSTQNLGLFVLGRENGQSGLTSRRPSPSRGVSFLAKSYKEVTAGFLPDAGANGTAPPDPPTIPRCHFIVGCSAGPAASPAEVVLDILLLPQGARRPPSPPPPPGEELTGAPATGLDCRAVGS